VCTSGFIGNSQNLIDSLFEDIHFDESVGEARFFRSDKVDFIQIQSTLSDSVKIAIVVYKPAKPSRVILLSHGWHQSVMPPKANSKNPYPEFLTIQVDMRGRKFSTGKADCSGYELYDFYDAYKYVMKHYLSYISDIEQVYFSGGSGGGGNAYSIVSKFPDLFCSVLIACGMSDYAAWYNQDKLGEFRDEMISWIGCPPEQCLEAYQSRSGISTVQNILSPLFIVHGENDIRVPVSHARRFVQKAKMNQKEVYYLELKGVGTRNHWGNITKDQQLQKDSLKHVALEYKDPPVLPTSGNLLVPGYVVTKHFSVFMKSLDEIGEVLYDLREKKITIIKGDAIVKWNE
tara:strand:+ start:22 stop:1056 length:1035 start_codon:yes stop_codon:yes gene_type:complete